MDLFGVSKSKLQMVFLMLFGIHYAAVMLVSVAGIADSGSVTFLHVRPWSSSCGTRAEAGCWETHLLLTSCPRPSVSPRWPVLCDGANARWGAQFSGDCGKGGAGQVVWPVHLSARWAGGWRRRQDVFFGCGDEMPPCPVLLQGRALFLCHHTAHSVGP